LLAADLDLDGTSRLMIISRDLSRTARSIISRPILFVGRTDAALRPRKAAFIRIINDCGR
jgi:hypothetical protein